MSCSVSIPCFTENRSEWGLKMQSEIYKHGQIVTTLGTISANGENAKIDGYDPLKL